MKVLCPCAECVYNDSNKCTAKKLKLKWRNMMTVNEGRVDMWICDKYSLDEETTELKAKFDEFWRSREVKE